MPLRPALFCAAIAGATSVSCVPLEAQGRTSCPSTCNEVIGDQNRLGLNLSRAQSLKVGRVIGPEDNGLAVDPIGSAATAFADAGEGVGMIGRSARPEADTIARTYGQ
jgi:hypothetical protein